MMPNTHVVLHEVTGSSSEAVLGPHGNHKAVTICGHSLVVYDKEQVMYRDTLHVATTVGGHLLGALESDRDDQLLYGGAGLPRA